MAPRAPTRGRPARTAAAAAAPAVAEALQPKRRGRPAEEAPAVADVLQPKRRGRPSKAQAEVTVPVVEEPKARRGGRPCKQQPVAEAPAPVAEPKKRAGRPRKATVVEEPPAAPEMAPKRRGRAPKAVAEHPAASTTPPKSKRRVAKVAALDLNRVAGSPRVGKQSSLRAKKATPRAEKVTAPAPAPRMDPRMRSKLRTRIAPTSQKAAEVKQEAKPKKRVRRPPKNAVALPPKKAPRKTAEHKIKDARGRVAKTASSAAAKPRKRRGFTTLQIPDKHVKHIQDVLQQLLGQGEADAEVAEEEAEMADDEQEVAPESDFQEQEDVSGLEPLEQEQVFADGTNSADAETAEEQINVEMDHVQGGAEEVIAEEEQRTNPAEKDTIHFDDRSAHMSENESLVQPEKDEIDSQEEPSGVIGRTVDIFEIEETHGKSPSAEEATGEEVVEVDYESDKSDGPTQHTPGSLFDDTEDMKRAATSTPAPLPSTTAISEAQMLSPISGSFI